MANAVYSLFKQLALGAGGNLSAGNLKAMLVTSGYAYAATDQYISAVTAGNRVTAGVALTSKTITNGVLAAANTTFPAVPTGTAAKAIVLYVDSGTDTSSPLVCYIDTATGLPDTPNGGDITVAWDTGANGIFAL